MDIQGSIKSTPKNIALTLSFFGVGAVYLWFVTSVVFA